jgi:hypothetical protein
LDSVCRADPSTGGIDIDYTTDVRNDCTGNVNAYLTYALELTTNDPPDPNGGWTTWTTTSPTLMTFPAGTTTTLNNTFSNQLVPPDATYYRVRLHIAQGNTCQPVDVVSDIFYVCTNSMADHPTGNVAPGLSPTMHHW